MIIIMYCFIAQLREAATLPADKRRPSGWLYGGFHKWVIPMLYDPLIQSYAHDDFVILRIV